jgi:anti-sigma regulatory factor (Ser/Thr protein kinase)
MLKTEGNLGMNRPHHAPAAPAAALAPRAAAASPGPTSDRPLTPCAPLTAPRPRRRVFPGRPDQASSARGFISEVLTRCPAAADAVLLTSELVANAVQHTATGGGGDFEVTASHGPVGLRVTVTDNGSGSTPALVPHVALATSGHGLMMVAALADRWGHYGNQHLRCVWFEIDCPKPQTAQPGKAQ